MVIICHIISFIISLISMEIPRKHVAYFITINVICHAIMLLLQLFNHWYIYKIPYKRVTHFIVMMIICLIIMSFTWVSWILYVVIVCNLFHLLFHYDFDETFHKYGGTYFIITNVICHYYGTYLLFHYDIYKIPYTNMSLI